MIAGRRTRLNRTPDLAAAFAFRKHSEQLIGRNAMALTALFRIHFGVSVALADRLLPGEIEYLNTQSTALPSLVIKQHDVYSECRVRYLSDGVQVTEWYERTSVSPMHSVCIWQVAVAAPEGRFGTFLRPHLCIELSRYRIQAALNGGRFGSSPDGDSLRKNVLLEVPLRVPNLLELGLTRSEASESFAGYFQIEGAIAGPISADVYVEDVAAYEKHLSRE